MAQIVLVTGKPRIGKTAFVVEMLMFDDYYKGRKLFSNINGLEIPHHKPPEGHSWEDLNVWLQWKENIGSVVVFDEVQNLFPARPAGSKMPDKVAWLNVHGHSAIDLILITQSPKIIDINLREVVGKHIHIAANKMGGLTRLEWNEVALNPTAQAKNALSSSHKIREEVFQYYKSAEAHTGHGHVKSRWYYVIIAMLIFIPFIFGLVGFMGYRMYQGYKVKAGMVAENSDNQSASSPATLTGNIENLKQNAIPQVNQGVDLNSDMFVPTLAERPESKPLYNSVRQVKQYERIAACIKGGKTGCTCYSDQATKLKEISKELCLDYVENGLPFDPFREPMQQNTYAQNKSIGQPENASSNQILELDGKPLPSLTAGRSERLAVIQ